MMSRLSAASVYEQPCSEQNQVTSNRLDTEHARLLRILGPGRSKA